MQYAGYTWVGLDPAKFTEAVQERDKQGKFTGPNDEKKQTPAEEKR